MSVFDGLDTMPDSQLRDLVAVTVQALLSSEDLPKEIPEDIASFSPRAAAREIATCISPDANSEIARAMQRALEDNSSSRDLSISTLKEIGRQPALAARIEAGFLAREKQLAIPEMLLLTGALLVLALKLTRVRWSVDEIDVTFEKSSKGIHDAILALLKRMPF